MIRRVEIKDASIDTFFQGQVIFLILIILEVAIMEISLLDLYTSRKIIKYNERIIGGWA